MTDGYQNAKRKLKLVLNHFVYFCDLEKIINKVFEKLLYISYRLKEVQNGLELLNSLFLAGKRGCIRRRHICQSLDIKSLF